MEQEIEEILSRSDRPISFQERVQARRRQAGPLSRNRLRIVRSQVGKVIGRLAALSLLSALAVAALAALVAGFSPLLAQILAVVSVGLLLAPIIQRFRRPNPPSTPMWRGRPVDFSPRGGSLRDQLRDRFRPPGTRL
jgi:hypothetical protein